MRSLSRNKQTIYYALYDRSEPIKDEYGNETPEKKSIYGQPKGIRACVSMAQGSNDSEIFGSFADYDRTVIIDNVSTPIDENSVFWIDNLNVIKPHDYKVKKIAKSLNHIIVAVSKVSVGEN